MRNGPQAAISEQLSTSRAQGTPSLCQLQQLASGCDWPIDLREALRIAHEAGFTLRATLPHLDGQLAAQWFGERWWLLHQSQWERADKWAAIVASRITRADADFACWPRWIEQSIRLLARERQTLLMVSDTTTAALVAPLVHATRLNCLQIRLPSNKSRSTSTVHGTWLCAALQEILTRTSAARDTLWVSDLCAESTSPLQHLPLRDRLLVALSHRLIALSIRPQGNTAQLISQRLQDERFPLGTVSMRLPGSNALSDCNWLDQRAVGWYLPPVRPNKQTVDRVTVQATTQARRTNNLLRCSFTTESRSLTQWTASASLLRNPSDYLVHCVRGHGESGWRRGDPTAILDALVHGSFSQPAPYQTLCKIVSEGRLRASAKMLRANRAAVSFSAVPLSELLARRHFQSHLGRWDWEPYGLMIRRDVLQSLGARPVIYGDEQTFEQLSEMDRNFFQPALRRSAHRPTDHWQAEEEWRLLDDVRLHELPSGSLILFVEQAAQAQALAAHSDWPVIWQQAHQTQRWPTVAASRRRRSARTSRN